MKHDTLRHFEFVALFNTDFNVVTDKVDLHIPISNIYFSNGTVTISGNMYFFQSNTVIKWVSLSDIFKQEYNMTFLTGSRFTPKCIIDFKA